MEPVYSELVLTKEEQRTMCKIGSGDQVDQHSDSFKALFQKELVRQTRSGTDAAGFPIFDGGYEITQYGKRYLHYRNETLRKQRSTRRIAIYGAVTATIAILPILWLLLTQLLNILKLP